MELTRGMAWPVSLDATGQFAAAADVDKIKQNLARILMTRPGEIVRRPEFGCRAWSQVFEPLADDSTLRQVEFFVREDLQFWEPRAKIRQVLAQPFKDEAGEDAGIEVDIAFEAPELGVTDELTFRFPWGGEASAT